MPGGEGGMPGGMGGGMGGFPFGGGGGVRGFPFGSGGVQSKSASASIAGTLLHGSTTGPGGRALTGGSGVFGAALTLVGAALVVGGPPGGGLFIT